MGAAAKIDSNHFHLEGAVFHDECVILYLIDPSLFQGRKVRLEVNCDETSEQYGQLRVSKDSNRPEVELIETLKDSDRAFSIIDSLKDS